MLSLGSGCRNLSSAIVSSVISEIEIWRVAVLMVNRYADEGEANSFMRAEELVLRFRNNVPMAVKPHNRFCSAKCGPLARD